MRISLTALTPGGAHDVVASGDDSTTVAVLAEALVKRLSGGATHALQGVAHAAVPGHAPAAPPLRPGYAQPVELWVNGRRLDPRAPVTKVLRDGDIVAFDPAGAAATWRHEPTGAVEIRVSSGPSAGTVARLGYGAATIGRSPDCAIPIDDPHMAPCAVTAHVTAEGVTIEPVPNVALTLDGVPVTAPTYWPDGGVLISGSSVFTLRVPEAPDAHLTPMPDGGLAYNRPPRLSGPSLGRTVEVPAEPRRLQILQEGSGAGVKVVLTGDRSTLVGRVSTQFDDRLVLKLTDPMDYTYVGMKTKDVPEHFPPGRAFRAGTGLREVQVALLTDDPAGTAQVAALHEIARLARQRVGDVPRPLRPFRVDALPPVIDLEEALGLDDEPVPPDAVVFGVGGDALGLRYFRAEEHGPGIVVAGPPKSGRSTALRTMATWLLGHGHQVALITPRRSPLRDLAGRPGVLGSFTADDDAEEIRAALAGAGRHALLIDDLELLGTDGELAEWVTEYVGELRDTGNLVIGASSVDDLDSMYRGPVVAMKKSRNGLLLRPTSTGQGDLLGVRLPRSVATGAGPVGRGLFVLGGQWEQIQVARA